MALLLALVSSQKDGQTTSHHVKLSSFGWAATIHSSHHSTKHEQIMVVTTQLSRLLRTCTLSRTIRTRSSWFIGGWEIPLLFMWNWVFCSKGMQLIRPGRSSIHSRCGSLSKQTITLPRTASGQRKSWEAVCGRQGKEIHWCRINQLNSSIIEGDKKTLLIMQQVRFSHTSSAEEWRPRGWIITW